MPPGTVYLVGAGPGDPELITVRGAECLARADVVIYDGLANPVLLDHAPPASIRIYAGKKHSDRGGPLTQERITALLIEHARAGRTVVRLKGGDPFVFGRGGEEAQALAAAGIPFEIVPGVTAATAVPAYAGIPITHRDHASTVFALATGHEGEGAERPPEQAAARDGKIDWTAVARADTIVLFMAVKTLPEITRSLLGAGRAASTPAAIIRWGTTALQRTVVGTLGDLAERAAAADLRPPALIVVGDVVRLRDALSWYERRPLFGARVLVPRQREQARGFARALVALGAEPFVVEVTRLEDAGGAALDAALARLSDWRWIAFTSANAVERTFEALLRAGRDARALAGLRVAAVGPATSAALVRRGVRPDLVPERQDGAGVAQAILADDPDATVLLPRAAEGREELVAALGARVTPVAAYRTVPLPAAELEPLTTRLRAGELDVLCFFSPSQAEAILAALGAGGEAVLARARVVAAIGGTTAAALQARGVRVDLTAPAPSAESLAEALVNHWKGRSDAVP
jgi:uroporphyrinogen III methyltransferase/synthase